MLLIGKPQVQSHNNMYYHALSYVGIKATPIPQELEHEVVVSSDVEYTIEECRLALEQKVSEKIVQVRSSLVQHCEQLCKDGMSLNFIVMPAYVVETYRYLP